MILKVSLQIGSACRFSKSVCQDGSFYKGLHLPLYQLKCLLAVVYQQESAVLPSLVVTTVDYNDLDYAEADFTLFICWLLISASHDPPAFPEFSELFSFAIPFQSINPSSCRCVLFVVASETEFAFTVIHNEMAFILV